MERRLLVFGFLGAITFFCLGVGGYFLFVRLFPPAGSLTPSVLAPEPTIQVILGAQSTVAVPATPTITPTPRPTVTRRQTNTLRPSPTPTPFPEPIIFEGMGDSVFDIDLGPLGGFAVAYIEGNAAADNFIVRIFDAAGEPVDLLVNVIEPYQGWVPVDIYDRQHSTRIQVTAQGDWKIEMHSFVDAHKLDPPDIYNGNGDDVIIFIGEPDIATINGNDAADNFIVQAIGKRSSLLVNEIEPYNGNVIIPSDTVMIIVNATGPWRIEVTAR